MIGSAQLRVAGILLPTALLLHEGAYGLGGAEAGGHGYLAVAAPLLVAAAASLVAASLLAALLRPRSERRRSSHGAALLPIAFAGALLAIFAVQELAEGLASGAGAAQLWGAMAGTPLLLPLALSLGLIAAVAADLLGWVGRRLAQMAIARRRRGRPADPSPTYRSTAFTHSLSPLAFGLARRPPPLALRPA